MPGQIAAARHNVPFDLRTRVTDFYLLMLVSCNSSAESSMGLFDKLFSRKADPDAERAKALFRKAWEDSGKPQGPYKAAIAGAEIRRRFFALVEEVEANLGV